MLHCTITKDIQIPQCVLGVRADGVVPRKTAGWDSADTAADTELEVFATWRLSGVE